MTFLSAFSLLAQAAHQAADAAHEAAPHAAAAAHGAAAHVAEAAGHAAAAHGGHHAAITPITVTIVPWLVLIPLFPLLGTIVNAFFGWRLQNRIGKRANHAIAIGAMVLSCIVAEVAFWTMFSRPAEGRFFQDTVFSMWESGSLKVDFSFYLDPLSMVMTLIVTHVATLIHIYSTGYMSDEPAYWRFFMWLNLFCFSMLLLVMGSNFVVMFFGWEGVGLCSYGLIGFWYNDVEKAKAAMKAFVVNRFGDFGFIIGLFLLFWSLSGVWRDDQYVPDQRSGAVMGTSPERAQVAQNGKFTTTLGPTVEFRELRDQIADESTGVAKGLLGQTLWGMPLVALIAIFMFVGATGKSAQLPLFVWLPDAMAGPTPVSALIHAATMVTAGVYMVARLNFLFALSPHAMTVVAVIGALTALFAASIGFFQYDIKKVLAYSTVSQLGFMFIGVGVGAYWAGVYHLMTHAFFKATLFLGSGSVIMACHHEQDMRKMGGLKKYTPITRWTYLIACWAIAGFPIASGFYSKDEILWKAWTAAGLVTPWLGQVIYVMGAVAALGTSFYMFRSYYMTFTGEYRGDGGHEDKERIEDPHAMATHAHANAALSAGTPSARDANVAAAAVVHQHDQSHGALPHGSGAHGSGHDDGHGGHGDGHHGGVPHESPRSMTWVLITLAAAAVLASLLGLPEAWTGRPPILEHWLAPSLTAQEGVPFRAESHSTELLFQGIGVAIAFAGWLAAKALYDGNRSKVPARLKEIFFTEWSIVFDKYYIDEIYQATVINGSLALSRIAYWFDQNVIDAFVNFMGWLARAVAYVDSAIDKHLVDGAVNGLAALAMGSGRTLRKAQTGSINVYLFGALGGALVFVIVQYMIR